MTAPTDLGLRQGLAYWSGRPQRVRSPATGYDLSLVLMAIALGLALLFEHYNFRSEQWEIFGAAIALAVWYGGIGPCLVSVALAVTSFDYFFTDTVTLLQSREVI
jgi:K+-sensing histidine kinase KdpD